ncbi:MAG: stage II sporulation protein M [Thermodesulfobacteriota bacterium]
MSLRHFTERLIPDRTVRRCLTVLAALFAAALPAGYIVRIAELEALGKALGDLSGPYRDMAGGSLFLLVLANNVFASLLLLIFGLLAGVVPVLSVAFNGFLLGLVYRLLAGTMGHAQAAQRLLPPAIFEVPALLVTAAFGLWLGIGAVRRFRGREAPTLGEQMRHAVERYFAIVFPLLIAAACIETFLAIKGP